MKKKIVWLAVVALIIVISGSAIRKKLSKDQMDICKDPNTGYCDYKSCYEIYDWAKASQFSISLLCNNSGKYKLGEKIILEVILKNNSDEKMFVPELTVDWGALIFSVSWSGFPGLAPCEKQKISNVLISPKGVLVKKYSFTADENWIGKKRISAMYLAPGGRISSGPIEIYVEP